MSINSITKHDVDYFKTFNSSMQEGINSLDAYQRIATKSAIYPGKGTPFGLAYVAIKLNGEAGEFAEHVGKAMRDDELASVHYSHAPHIITFDKNKLTPEKRLLLIKEIGDNLWYLSAACDELGIKLSDAATANLEKLLDRTERNALSGSGDNR